MTDTETIHRFAKQNMLVERYLLGELSGADLEDFERHMFECSICFEEVKAGTVLKQHLAAGVSAPTQGWWERIKEFFRTAAMLMLQLPSLPSHAKRTEWIPIFFAGVAIGVFLMAVLQHHSQKRNSTDFERLGNSIRAGHPRRWNGRYPSDAEHR